MRFIILTALMFIECGVGWSQKKKTPGPLDAVGIYTGLDALIFRKDNDRVQSNPKLIPALTFGLAYQRDTGKRLSHLYRFCFHNERQEYHEIKDVRTLDNGSLVIMRTESGVMSIRSSYISMSYSLGIKIVSKPKWTIYLGPNLGQMIRNRSTRFADFIEYGRRQEVAGEVVYVPYDEPRYTFGHTSSEDVDEYVTEVLCRTDIQIQLQKNRVVLTPSAEYYRELRVGPQPQRERLAISLMLSWVL